MVGRIAGPYRHCRSVERAVGRTRAGHVHAGRIADGVNLRGAALCASGPAPCGASWAGTVVPDRQRRAAATPRGYRAERGHSPCTVTYQPYHQDDPVPHCCHQRAHTRSSWGPARQSGRPSAGPHPFKLGAGAPVGHLESLPPGHDLVKRYIHAYDMYIPRYACTYMHILVHGSLPPTPLQLYPASIS